MPSAFPLFSKGGIESFRFVNLLLVLAWIGLVLFEALELACLESSDMIQIFWSL
jgi:hypothetical protein